MTAKEAIERLNRLDAALIDEGYDYSDIISVAIEALERQVPMSPKIKTYDSYYCDCCARCMKNISPYQNYCEECGQRVAY